MFLTHVNGVIRLDQSDFDKTARQRYQQPGTDTIVICAPNSLSL